LERPSQYICVLFVHRELVHLCYVRYLWKHWHYLLLCSPSWLSHSRLSLLHSVGDKIPGHAATHVQLYPVGSTQIQVCWVRGSVAGAVSDWKFVINCGQAREAFCHHKKPDRGLYQCWSYDKQSDLVKSIQHVSLSCILWKPAAVRMCRVTVSVQIGSVILRRLQLLAETIGWKGDFWQEGTGR